MPDSRSERFGARPLEPPTTVAWLMWHIASMPGRTAELDFLGGTNSAESGWTSPYIADHPVFASADEAVQTLRRGWRALDRELQASTDEQLELQTRFWGYPGPGPPAPGYQIVASLRILANALGELATGDILQLRRTQDGQSL